MKEKLLVVLFTIVFIILFTIVYLAGAAAEGFVIMKIWNWALVGLFPKLPTLTWLKATGLLILLNLVFPIRYVSKREEKI